MTFHAGNQRPAGQRQRNMKMKFLFLILLNTGNIALPLAFRRVLEFVRTVIAKDKAKWMQSMEEGVKAAISR